MGDQDPTFGGLEDALNNLLRSAWAGYVSFGSDTGGYRCCGSPDRTRGRTRELLLRWAQLNALMGLFENGGCVRALTVDSRALTLFFQGQRAPAVDV